MILVTGASGMIGRALAEHLCSNAEVRAQVRNRGEFSQSAPDVAKRMEVREADFTNISEKEMARLVADCSAVVHCAGLVHQPDADFKAYELLNIRTTRQLADAAMAAGAKTFVFLSTIAVYGEGPFENLSENAPTRAVTPYAVSKVTCEQQLLSGPGTERTIILRPALVFGEGDRGNMIKLIRQISRGRYFNVSGKTVRKSIIYSRDLARIIAEALQKAPPGQHVFNAANPQPVSLEELTLQIAERAGKGQSLPQYPEWLVRTGVKALETVLGSKSPVQSSQIDRLLTTTTVSCDRLVSTFGFQPKWLVGDALKAELDWARSTGQV